MCVCSVMSYSLQPQGCSPPGSSVHGIFQPRILEWVVICFRNGDPFQGLKLGSCLTLGNELSEETKHVLTKQEILLGKGTWVESRRVTEPRRTALLHGSQS